MRANRILWRPYKSNILFAFHFTDFSFFSLSLSSLEIPLWIDNFAMQYLLFSMWMYVWLCECLFVCVNHMFQFEYYTVFGILCTMYHPEKKRTTPTTTAAAKETSTRNSMWSMYMFWIYGCFNAVQNITLHYSTLMVLVMSWKMIWDIWLVKLSHAFILSACR